MVENVADFIEAFSKEYEFKHRAYEDNFWATKMNLAGNSPAELARTKGELDAFLGNAPLLAKVTDMLSYCSDSERKTLKCFEKVFKTYIIQDPKALEIKTRIDLLEADLAEKRNQMKLGYTLNGVFVPASSVQLRNKMSTSDDVHVRQACYNGLASIGPFVVESFCEIIKLRNQFARMQGFECFYDMKVSQAEGLNKKTLFTILDDLEARSKPILLKALKKLSAEKGADALLPYNINYSLSGDLKKEMDPYFPFENAVDCWARSFAALGISYKDAVMTLDLCDRPGKYSNGFCHWPQPAWISRSKGWVPSHANFTSLATPSAVGSGYTALVTLMHEGGHAAHFANVAQASPLFSQERAPTSVAYAENQSMFLDSLVRDSAWLARYALDRQGNVIPWDLIQRNIEATHAYQVLALRAMLAVPYFEKSLYELPEDQVTCQNILALAARVELDIQGGPSSRPLLSVPHILADESAAYYHGYVLADMSVYQTRAHFLEKYGFIVDNSQVGRDLERYYWQPGNSEQFLDLVSALTGKQLGPDAWIDHLEKSVENLVREERSAYLKALETGPKIKPGDPVDLSMQVKFVHGDERIADSKLEGLQNACQVYKQWVSNLK